MPILKGRQGEFTALAHAHDVMGMVPLLEVVPTSVEFNEEGVPNSNSVSDAIHRFLDRLMRSWPHNRRVIIDARLLPEAEGVAPTTLMVEAAKAALVKPDITISARPSDPDDSLVELGRAVAGSDLYGLCIRLANEDLDDSELGIAQSLDRVLSLTGVRAENADVLLDLGPVADERSAQFAARIARLVLGELPHEHAWRTVALGAGSFPSDLNSIQAEVLSEIPRLEPLVWQRVVDRTSGRVPIFSDYGIAHPEMASGAGFSPAPQLRYTIDEKWLIAKGRRRSRRGARQFLDICARVSEHKQFTPTLSWGDSVIKRNAIDAEASDDEPDATPGNAMVWRAIGTSHHLAWVTDHLARRNAP